MRSPRPALVLLLVLVPACGRPAPPPGPLDARVAALSEEVGRALGEPFGDPPEVVILSRKEIRKTLAAAPGDWSPLPGDTNPLFQLLGAFATEPGAYPVPGASRLLVTTELLNAAPETIDAKVARGLAGLWYGRRLSGPEFLAGADGPARCVRQLAANALAEETDRRLRAARGEPAPESGERPPLTEEERELLGPFLARSFEPDRAWKRDLVAATVAFRDAVVSAWGLGGALDELRRRPPETFREFLRPEEYVRGERGPDPASAVAARVGGVLEDGLELLAAVPLSGPECAELISRPEPPPGFVAGVRIVHYGAGWSGVWSDARLFVARDEDSASGLFALLLDRERAAESEWNWLSWREEDVSVAGGRGVVFHQRAFSGTTVAARETALLLRGSLVLRLELEHAVRLYTDGAGFGRRLLARALGDAPPGAQAWEERWWELARAGRIEEALADPDPRIRRRASARRDVMRTAERMPLEAFARACADPDPEVRSAALGAASLRSIEGDDPPEEVAAIVGRALADPDAGVRVLAAQCLDCAPWDSAVLVAAVARALRSDDRRLRNATVAGVSAGLDYDTGALPPEWIGALLELLGDESASVRRAAATALGYAADPGTEIRAALEARVDDPDADVRAAAQDSLRRQEER